MATVRKHVETLYAEQDGKCFYCNTEMFQRSKVSKLHRKSHINRMATFDHIVTKSYGGGNTKANGVCACWKCNQMRSDLPFQLFIENRAFIESEWDAGRRKANVHQGELICISPQRAKRKRKAERNRLKRRAVPAFWVAYLATILGKTAEDLFLENVYNSTYELIGDMYE